MSQHLNSKIFAAHLHATFEVAGPAGDRIPLELISVTDLDHTPKLEQFSLTFRGPKTPVLDQRIHQLHHEVLGGLSLFLVPVALDPRGMCYEAAFNLIRGEALAAS